MKPASAELAMREIAMSGGQQRLLEKYMRRPLNTLLLAMR